MDWGKALLSALGWVLLALALGSVLVLALELMLE
jgi:hypothetical protein